MANAPADSAFRSGEATESGSAFAYCTYPAFMATFMALSWGCLRAGFDAAAWIPALTVLSFLVILALEQAFPLRRRMNTLRDWQSINDAAHGVLTGLLRPLGTSLGLVLLAALSQLRVGAELATWWPAGWPLLAQLVLAHLLVSFAGYWVHRSLHTFDRLWWFHAVHHDTEQVHVLKAGRFHFVDEIYNAVLTPLPLLVVGAPTEVVLLRSMWSVYSGSLAHANVPQRFPGWFHYLVSNVRLHNLHHSRQRRYQDSNYAGVPVWDVLFGTFNHPDRSRSERFGLAGDYMPRNFFAQLWFPFRAQASVPAPAGTERDR